MLRWIRGLLVGLLVLGSGSNLVAQSAGAQSAGGQDARRLIDVIGGYAVFDNAGVTEVVPVGALSVVGGKVVLPAPRDRVVTQLRGQHRTVAVMTRLGGDFHFETVALLAALHDGGSGGASIAAQAREVLHTEWYDKTHTKHSVLTPQDYREKIEDTIKRHKRTVKLMKKAFPQR